MATTITYPKRVRWLANALWFAGAAVGIAAFATWLNAAAKHAPVSWIVPDARRYHDLRGASERTAAVVRRDSLALDSLDQAIADSAQATVARLDPAVVTAERVRHGGIQFAPEAMFQRQMHLRQQLAQERTRRDEARESLTRWLASGDHDTLGTHRR